MLPHKLDHLIQFYNTIKALREDVKDYMEFYNHRRFHETLDYKKPMHVYFENYEKETKAVS